MRLHSQMRGVTRVATAFFALGILLLATFLPGSAPPLALVQAAQQPAIKLRSAIIVPGLQPELALPHDLIAPEPMTDQAGYYILQFRGPIQAEWLLAIRALGIETLDYLPDFAFKVRMTPGQAAQVRTLAYVSWVGLFHPAYKLDSQRQRGATALYRVYVESGIDLAAVVRNAVDYVRAISLIGSDVMLIAADEQQIEAIARIHDVAWIEEFTPFETHNESAGGIIMGSTVVNANGYDGSTQIIAVADTGLGGGAKATAHVDVPSTRIANIFNWPGAPNFCFASIIDDGARDVDSGHGTHVTVSAVGDGGTGGLGKGVAPAARLVFQAIENFATISLDCQNLGFPPSGYYLTGLPANIGDLFQQAYNSGARIHTNSWGQGVRGRYTQESVDADRFVWEHQDMVITFSAGNDARDANSDGVVDNDSIGTPATAKNVITVGASENERANGFPCDTNLTYPSTDDFQAAETCSAMSGLNTLGTGQDWRFTTEPLRNDSMAGNQEQMAVFSSRGPTDDGRIKPDVVAPGTWVLSGYSDLYQPEYDSAVNPQNNQQQYDGWGIPVDDNYKYFGGTSMSTPLVAGSAAVVRDFYQKAKGHAASAALVKATLINSAVDMLDENNDGFNDNDFPIPNVHEGWGRVNLVNATDDSHRYVDDGVGIGTNEASTYQFSIGVDNAPFKVTLVWSDYPSTAAAAQHLVNDLDLRVISPAETLYRGNVFSGGWSHSGGSSDNVNNVENVYVQSAAVGIWTVEVHGYNVPNGPQPFALVVDGSFGSVPTPTSTTVPPTSTVSPTLTGTNTPLPPTATSPHTNTPTGTNTPLPPTATSTHTNTPTGTNTPRPPTATPRRTNTPVPPTVTSTSTNTSMPPTATLAQTHTPMPPIATPITGDSMVLYVSSSSSGTVSGVAFRDEDILAYNMQTGGWAKVFDGSDVGLGGTDVNAFTVSENGSLLLSITSNDYELTNFGVVDDSDILEFSPTVLGNITEGTWSLYFDGSDVGFMTSGEDIDSIYRLDTGELLLSTAGSFSTENVSGRDEDLVRFRPSSLGTQTAGQWALYFDGSDIGLSDSAHEDVRGVWLDESDGHIFLTTYGPFDVSGLRGDGADIFICVPGLLGENTSCTFRLYWDGSAHEFGDEIIDAFYIEKDAENANSLLQRVDISAGPDLRPEGQDGVDDLWEEDEDDWDGKVFLPLVGR